MIQTTLAQLVIEQDDSSPRATIFRLLFVVRGQKTVVTEWVGRHDTTAEAAAFAFATKLSEALTLADRLKIVI